jgi:hypothetical protein
MVQSSVALSVTALFVAARRLLGDAAGVHAEPTDNRVSSGAPKMWSSPRLPCKLSLPAVGAAVTLLGFFAGSSYKKLEQALGRGSAVLLAVVFVAAVVVWQRRRRARHREASPT